MTISTLGTIAILVLFIMTVVTAALALLGAVRHSERLVEGAVHWCRVTRSDPRGGGWGAIGDIPVRLAGGDARAVELDGEVAGSVARLGEAAAVDAQAGGVVGHGDGGGDGVGVVVE